MRLSLIFKPAMINSYPVLIFFVLLLGPVRPQAQNNFLPYRRFSLYRDPNVGPERGNTSLQFSLSDCAMQCLDDFRDQCHAFTFNAETKLCTTGTFLRVNGAVPSPAEGRLYISDDQASCDVESGYELLRLDDDNYFCVFFSTGKLKWVDAKAFCEGTGGYLAFVDSLPQVVMYDQHFRNLKGSLAYLWIGLSDLDVEDTFVWTHDGSVMSSEKIAELFKPGNPDNWREEDCVQIQIRYINDDDCDRERYHVCEKPFTFH